MGRWSTQGALGPWEVGRGPFLECPSPPSPCLASPLPLRIALCPQRWDFRDTHLHSPAHSLRALGEGVPPCTCGGVGFLCQAPEASPFHAPLP